MGDKGVLLGREQLLAANFTGKTSHYQYASVHVKPDGTTEATNGHYAIRVPPCPLPVEDYPTVAGMGAGVDGEGILIPAETCKAALKALPARSTIPILATAHLGTSGQEGNAVLTTTDLETHQPRDFKVPEGQFPNIDNVMPTDDTERMVIGMDARYLKRIAEYAIAVSNGRTTHVALSVSVKPEDAEDVAANAMRWDVSLGDGRKAQVALMPVKVCE